MMWGYGNGWGDAWGVVMIIVMLAVLALIGVGIYFLVRALSHPSESGQENRNPRYSQEPPPGSVPSGKSGAIGILEERYARGEIDREEFLRRRQDLLSGGGQ